MTTPASARRAGVGLLLLALALSPWVVGRLLTDDGRIDDPRLLFLSLAATLTVALGGLQLLAGWVGWVSFGRPVTLTRAAATSAVIALAAAGTYWRVESFREAHSHMHIVDAGGRVTAEQERWAVEFYERSLRAARTNRWFDFDSAMAQGFQPDRVNRTHYPNLENMFDGAILDPERPEWLIYYDNPAGGKTLMGFMFFTNKLLDRGPTPAGALAQWHYHPYAEPRCAVKEIWTVSRLDADGDCAEGVPVSRTPEMFHVWFIDHPLGRFTEMNVVPEYWQDDAFEIGALHPISVHFAIALFLVGVLLDLAAVLLRRPDLHKVAYINLGLALVATAAAVALGMSAELALKPTHETHATLDLHKRLAFVSLGGILLLGLWRYALRGAFPVNRAAATVYLLVSLAGAAAIGGAGYYGGHMVYEQGAGVKAIDDFTRDRYWKLVRDVYRQPEGDEEAAPATPAAPPPASGQHHH